MHEGQVVHDGFANPDTHDGASSPDCESCRAHTALHTAALQHNTRLGVFRRAEHVSHRVSIFFGALLQVDSVRLARRDKLLGERQPSRLHVRDDDRMRPGRAGGSKREEPDWSRAHDDDGGSKSNAGLLDALQSNTQRLEQRAFGERDVIWESDAVLALRRPIHVVQDTRHILVQPTCGMDLVSLERSVVGIHARKPDVLAEVVSPFSAQEAGPAGYAWLDGDSVPWRKL